MKKSLSALLLALLLLVNCLPVQGFAETAATETTQETEDPNFTETLPDLAEDAQAPKTDYAFGSVSILNGCRSLDGQMPLAGSNRKLDTAQSAIIYERNTGTLVYAYNPDMKLAPAALSKIVNALIVMERVEDLDTVVTVQAGIASRIPGGANSIKLKSEEQLTVRDLLHCMILQNAADAAVALAEYVAGTRATFVEMMNQRVKQMGCTSTSFTDVHGVGSGAQYTTARDMIRIMMAATDNARLNELLATQSYEVPATNLSEARKFKSQNYLMETTIVPKAKMKNLITNVSVRDGGLTAPIEKDEVIATVELWYQSSCLTEAQLLAQESVRTAENSGLTVHSALAPQTEGTRSGFSKAVLVICAVFLVPVISYLIINSLLRRRAKARRKKRRQERKRSK